MSGSKGGSAKKVSGNALSAVSAKLLKHAQKDEAIQRSVTHAQCAVGTFAMIAVLQSKVLEAKNNAGKKMRCQLSELLQHAEDLQRQGLTHWYPDDILDESYKKSGRQRPPLSTDGDLPHSKAGAKRRQSAAPDTSAASKKRKS